MKRIYLDYAATAPVDKRVRKAMEPYLSKEFGNTMSLHSFGQAAKIALEESRQAIAGLMGAKQDEIVFTSSATESNNLAIKGVSLANKAKGNHIIISAIEHPCIVESAEWLKRQGFQVTKLPVDKYGTVDSKAVERAIKKETILVSVMHASNEIGTIEPIEEIGKICQNKNVYFHTDASQSFGKILINVDRMNIDLLTASSHKIYGPKGAGLLYVRKGVKIEPVMHGGGQELGMRGSTVNVPAIVGFARAAEICHSEMKKENQRLAKLRDRLIKGLLKIEDSHLNGHPENRLCNNANIWFSYAEGESLVMRLDLEGIAVSTGSACSSFKLEPSHVLLATGLRPEEAHGSLRISLGRFTKKEDIDRLIKIMPEIVKKIRDMSPFKNNIKIYENSKY